MPTENSNTSNQWDAVRAELATFEEELQTALYRELSEALDRLRQRLTAAAFNAPKTDGGGS